MYIIKNALRSIARSKGRNILIGVIVLVIAVSACLALSIRRSADTAAENALADLTITANISADRSSIMKPSESGERPDRDTMREQLSNLKNLSLNELQTYAKADAVKDFYYTSSLSLDASGDLKSVDTTGTDDSNSSSSSSSNSTRPDSMPDMPDGKGFQKGTMGTQGDFTLIGYSGDNAMTAFLNGTSSVSDGSMFTEATGDMTCIISEELALYNSLSAGDTITLCNPNNEDETYTLTVKGIYQNSQSTVSTGGFMGGFSAAGDPANQIYASYQTVKAITDASSENATSSTDEEGTATTTAMPDEISGTYVFASKEAYESFEAQARALGLSDSYVVSSSDLTSYEQSLTPLNNLSTYAGWFLLVVLIIGGVILFVLNIFNVRERKYEVGVLTAIGMKKRKVMAQFMTELFVITLSAILIGAAIGGTLSVPITNTLLSSQITAQQEQSSNRQQMFGRDTTAGQQNVPTDANAPADAGGSTMQSSGKNGFFGNAASYVSEVSSAMDLTVLLELIGIGLLLTLVAGGAASLFIMRYEPLRILANRD